MLRLDEHKPRFKNVFKKPNTAGFIGFWVFSHLNPVLFTKAQLDGFYWVLVFGVKAGFSKTQWDLGVFVGFQLLE